MASVTWAVVTTTGEVATVVFAAAVAVVGAIAVVVDVVVGNKVVAIAVSRVGKLEMVREEGLEDKGGKEEEWCCSSVTDCVT